MRIKQNRMRDYVIAAAMLAAVLITIAVVSLLSGTRTEGCEPAFVDDRFSICCVSEGSRVRVCRPADINEWAPTK